MKKRMAVLIVSLLVSLLAFGGIALAWPQYLEGRPAEFQPGQVRGFFLWRDGDGLNLRTASNRNGHVYTGVIRTDGQFHDIRRIREEAGDHLRYNSNEIRFKFSTSPKDVDGVDFRVRGGSRIQFELYVDGHPMPAQEIHIGAGGQHPNDNTFSLHRNR